MATQGERAYVSRFRHKIPPRSPQLPRALLDGAHVGSAGMRLPPRACARARIHGSAINHRCCECRKSRMLKLREEFPNEDFRGGAHRRTWKRSRRDSS